MAHAALGGRMQPGHVGDHRLGRRIGGQEGCRLLLVAAADLAEQHDAVGVGVGEEQLQAIHEAHAVRSEEHTSELQSLMRISYAVFCLKKNTTSKKKTNKQ